MRMYMSLAVLFLVFLVSLDHGAESVTFSLKDLEIEKYLERMNQPAVKTIKSPTGEVIDCVDIYRQPSLDHPLLQNHTIQVNPTLYGDYKTRLFTYSTSDDYQNTGCSNLLCHGFVQTSKEIALGAAISPLSTYGGTQYQINIKIFKDNNRGGNWWLTVQGKPLGYWPNALLPALEGGAKFVEWGGEVYNSNQFGSTNTQMGSGHFAGEGDKKAAFFRNINTFDADGNFQGVRDLQMVVQKPKCYDLILDGTSFYYGGPGKNADCP